MPTHVALLRGINLGGKNRVTMADLRAIVSELGHADVSTYIQSGNVLFTGPPGADADEVAGEMSAAILAKLGVRSPVVVVTRDELGAIIAANPFPGEPDPRRLHAVVLSAPPEQDLLDRIARAQAQSEAKGSAAVVRASARTVYLHTPAGYGGSDLPAAVLRIVSSPKTGATGTARNWATMLKLAALCG
jgi:uncharacterized protein (DUF1697 family)